MERIDLKKEHRDLYSATAKAKEVRAEEATFLAVDGVGEPGGASYQEALGKLFSVAYTAKFRLKGAGVMDFGVPNVECLWYDDPKTKPMCEWRWRLLIRIPGAVTEEQIAEARAEVAKKKGLDASAVRRFVWTEGRALQMLHVGPYDRLGETYARLAARAQEAGLRPQGPGHEVYLSDPRRTEAAKLKTIVRMPVREA